MSYKQINPFIPTILSPNKPICLKKNSVQSQNNESPEFGSGRIQLNQLRSDLGAAQRRIQELELENQRLRIEHEQKEADYLHCLEKEEMEHDQTKAIVQVSKTIILRQSQTIEKLESSLKTFEERETEEFEKKAHPVLQRLVPLVEKVQDAEKRISHLRTLEVELEKSVLRYQRIALSRRSIYTVSNEREEIESDTEKLICREIIDRIELLEDVMNKYKHSCLFHNVAAQLGMLRDSFLEFLKSHSIDQFEFEKGTSLSFESRSKILLIGINEIEDPKLRKQSIQECEKGNRNTVLKTIRPGYIYHEGSRDVVLRKAEVILNS